jgi:metal-responsive CopG/Arc/MetJ family transcriptional regulator
MDIKDSSRILIDVPRELLRAIEDYRYTQRIPSRAEAIRQLIERGLHTTLTDAEPEPKTSPQTP